jgi:hypothetical protein
MRRQAEHRSNVASRFRGTDLNRPTAGTVGKMIRRRVVVAGSVQGVFFRDTCRRVALEQRVAGWVEGLPCSTLRPA